MAKISLRGYNREIENLINSGRTDEAIAHCKYVLKFFPKCIDTYRLMGKTYLEAQRYGEAADILTRVLSVLPDDFVSQIGMSIIREDEGNLDAAIFHMERAFEVKPSNSAIQEELRRLYGRRDGIEPPRVRLTRGALVRMYTRGELYPQAIAEIHAALAEEQKHVDLEIILAQIYLKLGRKVEATEICSRLVNKLPFCFEANRILAEILPGTSRAQDAEVYRQRVNALDPYAQFIGETIATSADAPDNLVTFDFQDYQSSQAMSQQPDWARAVGVEVQQPEESIPDWLTAPTPPTITEKTVKTAPQSPLSDVEPPQPASVPPAEPETALEVSQTEEEGAIPDWINSAGWSPSSGLSTETQTSFASEEEGPGELVQADIPEWLKVIAPSEEAGETPVEGEQDKLAMLDQLLTQQGGPAELAAASAHVPEAVKDNIPEVPVKAFTDTRSLVPSNEEAMPAWLAGIETPTTETPKVGPFSSEELPSWMEGVGTTAPPSEPQVIEPVTAEGVQTWMRETEESSSPEAQPAVPTSAEEIPAWLSNLETPEITQPQPIEHVNAEEISTWTADKEELPTSEEKAPEPVSAEDIPAWMAALGVAQTTEEQPEEQSVEPTSEAVPTWVAPQEPVKPQETKPAPEEVPDWMAKLKADGAVETLSAGPDSVEMPDWIIKLETSAPTETLSSIGPEPKPQDALDYFSKTQPVKVKKAEIPPVETTPATEEIWEAGTAPFETLKEEIKPQEEAAPALEEIPVSENQPEIAKPVEQTPAIPAGAPPVAGGEPTSIEEMDMDSAFAWLESLAAKQGADEGTLLVSPEDRSETPPAWLQQEAAAEKETELMTPPPTGDIQIAEEISQPPETVPVAQIVQPVEVELVEQTPSSIEEPAPSVFSEPVLETPSTETEKPEEEPLPDWMKDLMAPAPGEYMATAEVVNPESITAWLKGVDVPPEISKAMPTQQAPEAEPEALPEWLQEIVPLPSAPVEKPSATPEALPEWLQEAKVPAAAEPVAIRQEPLPEWLHEVEAILPAETPTLVVEISEPAAEVGTPTKAVVPINPEEPATTLPSEALPEIPVVVAEEAQVISQVAEMPEAAVAAEEAPVVSQVEGAAVISQIEEIQPTVIAEVFPEPVKAEILAEPAANYEKIIQEAQAALDQSNLVIALERYNILIESNQLLEETIHDLRNALYRHPVDIRLHISLGDAYAHGNRLQDALDTYTKAEELLR